MIKVLQDILKELKQQNMNSRLWDLDDLSAFLKISKSRLYKISKHKRFPRPIIILDDEGRETKRWAPDKIKKWVDQEYRKAA